MNTQGRIKQRVPLVVIERGGIYKRFVGHTMTHHVRAHIDGASAELDAAEIEKFRRYPDTMVRDSAA